MLETSDDPLLQVKQIESAIYPSLKDKSILITGGGSGIGMYLVESFCSQGAKVGFLDINADASVRVCDIVEQTTGNRPIFTQCDLTDISSLTSSISVLRESIGPIGILLNNAANDGRHSFENLTPEYWDESYAVNLRHHAFASQAVLPDMKSMGGGVILSMGSISWMESAPNMLAYTTAKSAIQGFVRCLAQEIGEYNIRVNAIAPGWVLTDRQVTRARDVMADQFESYLTRQALSEFILPPDIARMALFLCADDSRLITGQTMIVDGGVV